MPSSSPQILENEWRQDTLQSPPAARFSKKCYLRSPPAGVSVNRCASNSVSFPKSPFRTSIQTTGGNLTVLDLLMCLVAQV